MATNFTQMEMGLHAERIALRAGHPAQFNATPATQLGKGNDLWVIDSLAATPLVEPDVRFHQTGHLQSHTVVLPTDDFEHPPYLLVLRRPTRPTRMKSYTLICYRNGSQPRILCRHHRRPVHPEGNGWERMIANWRSHSPGTDRSSASHECTQTR